MSDLKKLEHLNHPLSTFRHFLVKSQFVDPTEKFSNVSTLIPCVSFWEIVLLSIYLVCLFHTSTATVDCPVKAQTQTNDLYIKQRKLRRSPMTELNLSVSFSRALSCKENDVITSRATITMYLLRVKLLFYFRLKKKNRNWEIVFVCFR